ncbi:mandelate racemase/muconate lactonizing enzyme family protein [Microbacterium immunditiarum]|uniref:L-alanine-DL-glutamate epimerase-like enolase superfamily enzyme n=1 Tax=Microbacterium immunditiarum TaxID=337480 RepID=A0A7Y9GM02_9MICO|nr:mandelate racemase/muconate lactonizing enzyme family protein [Microbacterium immunditiarum]NYE18899.1 L-alanine-DL-glutamate epimerase-like enolase superfamily enzyme [Microbacterium immunditiarum]
MTHATAAPPIDRVETRLLTLPLRRPWGHDVTDVRVVYVSVTDADGATGHGFSWTPSIGGTAVRAMIDTDLVAFAIGRPAAPTWWDDAWRHLHEAGGGGVTTIALAGLDLALWDLVGRRAGQSITDLLGRRHETLEAYGSGVNLHYPLDELVAQAQRWVEAGFGGVKVKVGRPDLAEDVDRLAAVREVIGPDRALMVDANQRWALDRAVAAVEALGPIGIAWLEEPLRADDLAGHVALRRETGVRIAVGENLHTEYRFREFLEADAAQVLQPNIVRVGGITPALRIARAVQDAGAELAFHLLPELSAPVAFSLGTATRVEVVEDALFTDLGALAAPTGLVVTDGRVGGEPTTGLGIRFR